MNPTAQMQQKQEKSSAPLVDQYPPTLPRHSARKDHRHLASKPQRKTGITVVDTGRPEENNREEWVQLRLDADLPWSGT